MTILQMIFYFFSAMAVGAALMVVVSQNPVRGALFLVLTFFAMAGIWILLHAEFLALILVLVYVGAVMTLFLFVVMMLRTNVVKRFEGFVPYLPFAVVLVLMIVGLSIMVVMPSRLGWEMMPAPDSTLQNVSNIQALGLVLYTDYVYPFEISAVILLTAIVAAISLSHRKAKDRRSQRVSQQVAVKAKDRVRLLQITAEKKVKSPKMGQ